MEIGAFRGTRVKAPHLHRQDSRPKKTYPSAPPYWRKDMTQQTYTPGQRWISDTEPDLGLGTLIKTEGRTLTLIFLASNERRTYARDNAPITRVRFAPGDTAESQEGWKIRVHSLAEEEGLIIYLGEREDGTKSVLPENRLSNFTQFHRPQDRLFSGQIDDDSWFRLRQQTLKWRQRLAQDQLIGLGGARTELLPHQLYVANEAGQRFAPRVLLADEVGLGKTIEACLILHRQILTGQCRRCLILVPSPLLHQWLVELLRRFNLRFSLYDEERCQAIEESDPGTSPFQSEQLVLCGLDLLHDSRRLEQALDGDWDTLIVDEAHHLEWNEERSSAAYLAVERLAAATPSVLLLTATPEQLGEAGHFARLRLLDPDRFYDLEAFRQEEQGYRPIAEIMDDLLSGKKLAASAGERLLSALDGDDAATEVGQLKEESLPPETLEAARNRLILMLLDRHGTGRVMFRNTRDRVKGFAARRLHAYPLPLPDRYAALAPEPGTPEQLLTPEALHNDRADRPWWQFDPRIDWLTGTLRRLKGEKLLLICAHSKTAQDLETALRIREGIHAALFHEGMSIIERDRAAAWFAEPEQGSPLLICSEIGSEGRNFQFAHQLVLFDLPFNPDLLEQRIGRLDRIGQKQEVQILVPYFEEGPQSALLRWYQEGLNAFEHTCPPGQQILKRLKPALREAMENADGDSATLDLLVETTRKMHTEISEQLRQGRDHLLEINSCREPEAGQLKSTLSDNDLSDELPTYMEALFNSFGIESEPHSPGTLILKPGAHMLTESFPHLAPEGMTATFDRTTALTHEERQFLTWEHPMVRESMEMLLENEQGNSCVIAVRHPEVRGGTLMLELLFVLECPAPRALQAGRFLPPTLIRVLVNQGGDNLDQAIPLTGIDRCAQPLDRGAARNLVAALRKQIQGMLERGDQLAESPAREAVDRAGEVMRESYGNEIARLRALQRVNPSVRPEEIELLERHRDELEQHFLSARVRLDSLRLIVGL